MVANETGGISSANPETLPISIMPIVRFKNNPNESELLDVLKLQALINKSLSDTDILILENLLSHQARLYVLLSAH